MTWKEAMEEKGLRVNAGKTKFQTSFHMPSIALEWEATASFAKAASTGCTKNAVGSSA